MNIYPLLADIAIDRMNDFGAKILELIQDIAYWYIGFKCIADVIKLAGNGERKSIFNVILAYVFIYGACFFVPWIFDTIKAVFTK